MLSVRSRSEVGDNRAYDWVGHSGVILDALSYFYFSSAAVLAQEQNSVGGDFAFFSFLVLSRSIVGSAIRSRL